MTLYKTIMIAPKTKKGRKNRIHFRKDYHIDNPTMDYLIQKNANRKNIYKSVYDFESEVKIQNVIVDRVYLDFDPIDKDEDSYDNCLKVASCLFKKDIAFQVDFTGRGFRIFIFTEPLRYDINLKLRISTYVKQLMNECNAVCDFQVVADLNRVTRCLGTINLKTGLYCIPLTYNDISNFSYEFIKQIASNPNGYEGIIEGNKLVDLLMINIQETEKFIYDETHIINNYSKVNILPPCLMLLLSKFDVNNHERFLIILYLRDEGYSIEEAEDFLEENMSEDRFDHCINDEQQLDYLYDRSDLIFPRCETLMNEGVCQYCGKPNHLYI